jgi:drug/metabolite transporter (DMT)-like permease
MTRRPPVGEPRMPVSTDSIGNRRRDALVLWGLFLTASLIWGSSFLLTAVSLREVPTFSLVTYRISVGALVLGVSLLLRRRRLGLGGAEWRAVAIVGIFNVAGSFSLITTAQETLPSARAAVLVSALPLFSTAFGAAVLANERLTIRRISGLALGFGGVIVVFSKELASTDAPASGNALVASALVLIGVVMVAGTAVYVKLRLQHLSAIQLILPQLLVSIPIVATIAWLVEADGGLPHPDSADVWAATIVLGALGAGIANLCFYRLIAGWGVTRTTLISYAIPVVGVTLGVIVLGERLGVPLLAGTALIMTSIGLVSERGGAATPSRRPGAAQALPVATRAARRADD